MKRQDDFSTRRAHLSKMSDEQLNEYFWKLTNQVIDPLIKLGQDNTSPSIERSVLLRMGFSSIEAKSLVEQMSQHSLLQYGAGNVVYRFANLNKIDVISAGKRLIIGNDWTQAINLFKEVKT